MIKTVRMINCQSCEDVTLDLATDKLNVIVADNDNGKSVIFKMLKLVGCPKYYDRKDRQDLIRRGASYAGIVFDFTDGSGAFVKVLPERVMYGYREDADSPLVQSLEPPKELLQKVGLMADVGGSFVANIIDSDQDLLLVDPKLAYNYVLVQMLIMNEDLDKLQERINELLVEFKDYNVRTGDHLNFIDQRIRDTEFQDVDKMQAKHDLMEKVFDALYLAFDVDEQLQAFNNKLYEANNFDELIQMEEFLEDLEGLAVAVEKMKLLPEPKFEELLESLEDLEEMQDNLKAIKIDKPCWISEKMVDFLDGLETVNDKLQVELEEIKIPFEDAEKLLDCCDTAVELKSSVVKVLGLTEKCDSLMKEVKDLEAEFSASGKEIECPIHGKVIFDGKDCVADSK